MKKQIITILLYLVAGTISQAQVAIGWSQIQAIDSTTPAISVMRTAAIGFSIGNKGYTGTGKDANGNLLNDFWEYDPITNAWTQKANLTGPARSYAVGFSIGAFGYIGTGKDSLGFLLNDFWQYDQSSNTWARKADFEGSPRLYSVGFSIGNDGYLGLGDADSNDMQSDFWKYDPSRDLWTQKARFAGRGRRNAVAFSIGTAGYVGIGADISSTLLQDFWQYDPSTDNWLQKADFGGGGWELAVAFSINDHGYVGTGYSNLGGGTYNSYNKTDFWQYDPSTNTWTQQESFGGHSRYYATGFSIGNKGYLGTGQYFYFDSNNVYHSELINDFWVYNSCSNKTVNLVTQIAVVDTILAKLVNYSGILSNGSAVPALQWSKNLSQVNMDPYNVTRNFSSIPLAPGHTLNAGEQCVEPTSQIALTHDTLALLHKTGTTSIDSVTSSNVSVNIYGYANKVGLTFNDFVQQDEITLNVYDLEGRMIFAQQKISTGNNRYNFSLEIINGFYLVVLNGNNYQKVGKVFLTNN